MPPTQLHPAPTRTVHDAPFWEAAARGVLLIKRCEDCARPHYFPRRRCPFCGSEATVWVESSGRGTVYSFSIVSRTRRPTAVALVDLEEGVRIPTGIVDADLHAMRIGEDVTVRFEPAEDGTSVPLFSTVGAEEARAYAAATLAASAQVPGVDPATASPVSRVAVVGAGTMGGGIARSFLAAGVDVVLIDPDEAALRRGQADLAAYVARLADTGVATGELRAAGAIEDLGDVDLVVEAVWEQLSLKEQVFAALERAVRPDCILATNTSTLDIDAIAAATTRPERVVGMHFFSPAHVMRLVEVVRAARTSPAVLATVGEVARRLAKVPVVVGVCHGFVGNRMMLARSDQAAALLVEGALPDQVDRVAREFGFPMGPFEMADLGSGIEVNYRRRQETGEENWLVDRLYEAGHRGQKSGRGYYRYQPDSRTPLPDPDVTALIEQASARAGVRRRRIDDAEIRDRLVLSMINEGARLLEEGIALRAGDIDVVWRAGFGWPDWKGGPMYHADALGLPTLVERLEELATRYGAVFEPARLLRDLAAAGGRLTGEHAPEDVSV